MQEQYLVDRGIAPYLDDFNFPPTWRRKDQIDWVLLGDPAHLCYCGSKAKVGSKWCGLACKNKDPEVRSHNASVQRSNITRRMSKMRATMMSKYGVDHVSVLAKTEVELMEEVGAYRVWDCGHWKYLIHAC